MLLQEYFIPHTYTVAHSCGTKWEQRKQFRHNHVIYRCQAKGLRDSFTSINMKKKPKEVKKGDFEKH